MIKPGMTIAEAIMQLTRGFIKMTGRNPDGLEKIKIKQEAVQKLKDLEKVVDMEGNFLDSSKPIMGGTQVGMFDNIFNKMQKQMGKGDPKVVKTNMKKMIDDAIEDASPGFADDIKYDAEIVAENLAERMGLVYDDLPTKQRLDLYDQAYTGLSKQRFKNKPKPEDKAYGGRIGLKDGPDLSKRNFMKILGGLAAIPVFGKFFRQADKVAPATQKVMENFSSTASEAPGYFFDLVTKIKMLGKQSKVGPSERMNEFSYTGKNGDQYTLTEDIVTGDAQIIKDKMGVGSYGDKTFDTINDRTVLEYKAPKQDVDVDTGKSIRENAEYEEYRVEFDQDGTEAGADAIDEMIQKEIIEEATKSAPPIKKAGGGLAYMLGE